MFCGTTKENLKDKGKKAMSFEKALNRRRFVSLVTILAILLGLVTNVFLFPNQEVQADPNPGWLEGYTTRKKLTIDQTKVDADLTDFPVLVKLTSANFDFSKSLSNGHDIRFTASDGKTLLKYERERHDAVNQVAEYWVKIPFISGSVDTEFYIYYRNIPTPDGADPTAVWETAAKGVWHLRDWTPTSVADSTVNENHGQKIPECPPVETDAKIGKGQEEGVIDIGDKSSLEGFSAVTIEAWIKPYYIPFDMEACIVAKELIYKIDITPEDEGIGRIRFLTGNDWVDAILISETTINTYPSTWHHIVATYDGSIKKIFINGSQDPETVSTSGGLGSNERRVSIGAYDSGAGWADHYFGVVDEVRIYNRALSTAEAKASYHSGNDTLLTYGVEEKLNRAPNTPTLVSPTDGSFTSDDTPTLSAHYSDPDPGDTGTTNYRIATSSANCLAGIVVASGTSSETLTNNETTTWTPSSSIGSDGTYYWCTRNNDGSLTSDWTVMGSFILDTSIPDIVAVDAGASSTDRMSLTSDIWFNYSDTGSDDQISFSWTDPNSVSGDTFYYELNSDSGDTISGDESTTTNPYIDNISISEGISYFHVRPKNGAGTWGRERIFIIKYDKTPPTGTTLGFGEITATSITVTVSGASDSGSGLHSTPYYFDRNNGEAVSGWWGGASWQDTNLSVNTKYTYKVKSKDAVNNESDFTPTQSKYTLANPPSNLSLTADSQTQITASWSANSNPAGTEYFVENVTAGTNSGWITSLSFVFSGLSCNTSYSFRVKARNGDGVETAFTETVTITTRGCPFPGQQVYIHPKPPTKPPEPDKSLLERIRKEAQNILERLRELTKQISKLLPPVEEIKPPEVPIEELLPKEQEVPLVFQGKWQLLSPKPIREFVLAPLPKEIKKLAKKFPELEKTFDEVGISKITDILKLKTVKLTLPGLTEKVGLPTAEIQPSKFALPKGVPVAELSPEAKEQIPTEILFAKTGGELIDFRITLSVTEKGEIQQKIITISGKPLQLVVKPDKPVKSVKGYVVFKSKTPRPVSFKFPLHALASSLIFTNPVFAKPQEQPVRVEEKLVLLEFEYTDSDGDGIYTAEILAPVVEGKYEIITVMDFEDPELGTKEIRLITVVDPEGYIYTQLPEGKLRVADAIVSLYWLNEEINKYELWPAQEYHQENPQRTDDTGHYSFLVPEGTYYLKIEHPDYLVYQSEIFVVKEGSGINMNIELKTKFWWLKIVDWKTILLILVILLLLYNFYRDRIREKQLRELKNL